MFKIWSEWSKYLHLCWCSLMASAENGSLSMWSWRSDAHSRSWSSMAHGVVIDTVSMTRVFVKDSSVKAYFRRCAWFGSPSSNQTAKWVWSRNNKIPWKLDQDSWVQLMLTVSIFISHINVGIFKAWSFFRVNISLKFSYQSGLSRLSITFVFLQA